MAEQKYNIPNLYVDLIRKIKQIEGIDIEYIDRLVEILYNDINLIGNAVDSIMSYIPSGTSNENQLVNDSGLANIELDLETLTASVSHIDMCMPDTASSSNKLATANDIPATYAGSSTAGGAANSVKGTLTTEDADYNTYTYNGSHNLNIHFRALHCTIPSTGWSNTTDADGYYTNQIVTDTINAYNTPLVSCCGEFRDTLPTSAQKAAFNLCDVFVFQDSTQSNRMTVKAKVKPTTTFYVCIHGIAIATT